MPAQKLGSCMVEVSVCPTLGQSGHKRVSHALTGDEARWNVQGALLIWQMDIVHPHADLLDRQLGP